MNKTTLKALRGSIRKWDKIVKGTGKDNGADNCPLCERFNRLRGCDGCPVESKTGRNYCEGTPYEDYFMHRRLSDAKAMLKFLKSLLPKKPQ